MDPGELSDTTLGTPRLHIDTVIPPLMLTLITYGNGNQDSPTSIATFTLQSQGFRTKVTFLVLDLANELDVLLNGVSTIRSLSVRSMNTSRFPIKTVRGCYDLTIPTHRQVHHPLLSVLAIRLRVLDKNNNALSWSWFSG